MFANAVSNLKTGDLFSPVLVKEIRQGMRTRTFVGVFLLVQVVMMFTMILSILGAAATDGGRDLTEMGTVIFWLMVSLPLALIMPARGFNAVGAEIRSGTLEPLHLTRLSAWRIVFGKWFSLFAQTLLLLISLMPYAVLRYFLGGINIVDELVIITFQLVFSAVLTALAVGSSAFQSVAWRIFMGLGFAMAFITVPGWVFSLARMGFGVSSSLGAVTPWAWVLFLVLALLVGYLFLEYGAAEIAPPAENHAFRKRLTAFLILGCAFLFKEIGNFEVMIALAMMVVLVVIGLSLIERPAVISSLYYRNATRPGPVRFLMKQFYPGWPFALGFCIVAWGACFVLFRDELDDEKAALAYVSIFASLVWCAAVTHLLLPATRRPVGFFLLLQIACILLAMLASALQGIRVTNAGLWLIPFPPAVFWQGIFGGTPRGMEQVVFLGVSFMAILSLVVLGIRGSRIRKMVADLEHNFRERKKAAKNA